MSSRRRGGEFEENGLDIHVTTGIRAGCFGFVRVMAIDTRDGHMDVPGGCVCMTLAAKRIRLRDRFILTRLLVAPRNLFQHDAVPRTMTIVTVDRVCALRMDAVLPDRNDLLLARLDQRGNRLCRLNRFGWWHRGGGTWSAVLA